MNDSEGAAMTYNIISVRQCPEYLNRAVEYFSSKWSVGESVYRDCIFHSLTTDSPLPRWYLLLHGNGEIVGSFGLIANDFNSRQDLWPWIAALYVEESERGQSLGGKMLAHGVLESKRLGFSKLYLTTDHIGYYEKYGFTYVGQCYSHSGEPGRLYEIETDDKDKTGFLNDTRAELYSRAIEPISELTRDLATTYIIREWQTAQTMIRGEIIDCSTIDGFILTDEKRESVLGLATYIFRGDACEIVTMNSERQRTGLGTALIEKVKAAAVAHGCKTLRLMTSNDNLNAFGFYQKRGFELVGVNIGAIDRERETNTPEIPLIGQNGIPFRHEMDLSMHLE